MRRFAPQVGSEQTALARGWLSVGRIALAIFVAAAFLLVAPADLAHHIQDRDCDSGHPESSHSCLLCAAYHHSIATGDVGLPAPQPAVGAAKLSRPAEEYPVAAGRTRPAPGRSPPTLL